MNWYQQGVPGAGGVPSPATPDSDYVSLPLADSVHITDRGHLFGLTPDEQVERLAQHLTMAQAITGVMLREVGRRNAADVERLTRIAALLDEIEIDLIAPMRHESD